MAKLTDGMLGSVIGSMANTTSYMLNGQNVTRVKFRRVTKFSEKQLENQMRMAVLNKFLRPTLSFLKVGFGPAAAGTIKNYHNLATSYNKKHALKGVYPAIEMDYAKVLLSTGDLLPAQNPVVEWVNEGLKFSWDRPGIMSSESTDQVMMLAYAPQSGRAQRIAYGPLRSEGSGILRLADDMKQEPWETYISFVSGDRLGVANSIYTGRIEPA